MTELDFHGTLPLPTLDIRLIRIQITNEETKQQISYILISLTSFNHPNITQS